MLHINLPIRYDINTLAALEALAKTLLQQTSAGDYLYLSGDLGSGKTTFAQYFIRAAGFSGRITSPTYAIMQDYDTKHGHIIHADLYRLSEPEELDEIGLVELAHTESAIVLVEWPEKAAKNLPAAKHHLHFSLSLQERLVEINTSKLASQ